MTGLAPFPADRTWCRMCDTVGDSCGCTPDPAECVHGDPLGLCSRCCRFCGAQNCTDPVCRDERAAERDFDFEEDR